MSSIIPSIGTRLGAGWGTYIEHAPYTAGRSFDDVLGEQVRFRIIRSGSTSIDDVRPDSAAAAKLWEHRPVRDVVEGVLNLAMQASGRPTPLRGFSLATDEAGYVANRAVHSFREGEPTRASFRAGIEAARAHTSGTAAVRKGAWLHMGPERSAGLLEVLERTADGEIPSAIRLAGAGRDPLGRGVKTLLHELNHVGSPRPPTATSLDWLSEGTAETLARWPGWVRAAGATLGIHVPPNVGTWFDAEQAPYQEEVDAVRALLRMSGIDTSRPSHFSRAEVLLNRTPEDQLPAAFAERIAERSKSASSLSVRGGHSPTCSELQLHIKSVIENDVAPNGSNAHPAPLRDLAASPGLDA